MRKLIGVDITSTIHFVNVGSVGSAEFNNNIYKINYYTDKLNGLIIILLKSYLMSCISIVGE